MPHGASDAATGSFALDTTTTTIATPILGIWRLGAVIARGDQTLIHAAQPADATGSPRWDYVLKTVTAPASPFGPASPPPSNLRTAIRQIHATIDAASVSHPNLIAILDASPSADRPYVVMPRLHADQLDKKIAATSGFSLPVALWWTRQIAQALTALHRDGWIHGDVKPANVLVDSSGHVTLVDLGFAARIHSPLAGTFRGTPQYASPELIAGKTAALPAMDIFSLGRILWQGLTHLPKMPNSLLEPVAELVESMVDVDATARPTAHQIVKRLLSLEIETLGYHIGPTAPRRSAAA